MLCKLHLSKLLKINHTIESNLHPLGLHTTISFPDINIKGTLLDVTAVGKGNTVTIDIDNSKDWYILNSHINNWNGVNNNG